MTSASTSSRAVVGRIVGRRRVSARLAFYDLLVEASATVAWSTTTDDGDDASRGGRLGDRSSSASLEGLGRSESVVVELVVKLGAEAFADEDAFAAARREAFKLGNVVDVVGKLTRGRWDGQTKSRSTAAWVLTCEGVNEVVEAWATANPGKCFARELYVQPAAPRDDSAESKPGDTPAPCKFFINNGYCAKGDACKYAHDRAVQREWIAARKAKRREIAATQYGDPHGDAVANKSARAVKFAEWLRGKFGDDVLNAGTGILDVAGGRGDISFELFTKQGIKSTLVEPRARKLNKQQHKWLKAREKKFKTESDDGALFQKPELCEQIKTEFTSENWHLFKDCSVVIGMHPDQATEAIVDFANLYDKPFAIVPCCVFPELFNHRRDRQGAPVTERMALVEYLADKTGGSVEYLDIEGANQVVFRTS